MNPMIVLGAACVLILVAEVLCFIFEERRKDREEAQAKVNSMTINSRCEISGSYKRQGERIMTKEKFVEKKFVCQTCGAPLLLFVIEYVRFEVNTETGEITKRIEEEVPGGSECQEYQCSEDAEHDCGVDFEDNCACHCDDCNDCEDHYVIQSNMIQSIKEHFEEEEELRNVIDEEMLTEDDKEDPSDRFNRRIG